MTDTAKLRALLAAATPGKWYVVESPWGAGDWLIAGSPDPHGGSFVADTEDPTFEESELDEDEIARHRPLENAALIAAAVNALPALLDELEALRDVADRACTIADEANGPHPVQSADDALTCIERELFDRRRGQTGAIQELQAQLTAWRTATGCDTPTEAAAVAETLDAVARYGAENGLVVARLRDGVVQRENAELARLRELERTVLEHRQACEEESGPVAADDTDEQMHARIERLNRLGAAEDAAIAACRAAKEGT